MKTKARVIAFYLPQYHPIPENDAVWGKGFTEWTNVARAKPLFKGHVQPNVPTDLGFYDLRLPIIREQQAEMARDAGIEGFMYWHYWLGNGRMLLEKPFQEVLRSGKPDYPFCLGWANHSWTTKSWHGANGWNLHIGREYIAKIVYPGKEDYKAHFEYCLPAFKDKRYIMVDNKPLFYIWAPNDHPEMKLFIDYWQELALQHDLKGIHFVANVNSREGDYKKYMGMGFDAVNYNTLTDGLTKAAGSAYIRRLKALFSWYIPGLKLNKYDYGAVVDNMKSIYDTDEYCYPTILPRYDRTPRAGRSAIILSNPNPRAFKQHVNNVIKTVENKKDDHKVVFLKSWNEWGEGNYMEPDLQFGHAFLDALKSEVIKD